MKKQIGFLILALGCIQWVWSQDTFSIVAVDSVTGEVGSAGASCVDLNQTPITDDSFLGVLVPAVGVINTQASYLESNQDSATQQMMLGKTPGEIVQWMDANDITGEPERRQYGVAAMVNGSPQAAAYTGTGTLDFKGHIVGPNYAIQGNILSGQAILDSMEARFLREPGDLACKLMAAMQGAKVIGADSRCATNQSSSLFAFVKVAQPTDNFGSPSLKLSFRSSDGEQLEPIDSLQARVDALHACIATGVSTVNNQNKSIQVVPNPSSGMFNITGLDMGSVNVTITDVAGIEVFQQQVESHDGLLQIDLSKQPIGIYLLQVKYQSASATFRVVKQ